MKKRYLIRFLLFTVFFFIYSIPTEALEWKRHDDKTKHISFLSLKGPPSFKTINDSSFMLDIWHIGFLNDGSNGAVVAITSLKDAFSKKTIYGLTEYIFSDIKRTGKVHILNKTFSNVGSIPTLNVWVVSKSSNGMKWFGRSKYYKIQNTIFNLTFASPVKERLDKPDIEAFLCSLIVLPDFWNPQLPIP